MPVKKTPAESPTNVEIVTYALASLNGLDGPVHLEKIAVKAHQLAPGAFRWDLDEFASYIDKDKVRVSLTDAEKVGKGQLVEAVGTTRGGRGKRTDVWRLTAAGSAWVVDHREPIKTTTGLGLPAMKRGRAQDLRRRITGSGLFQQYTTTGTFDYNPYEFADLLECSPDAKNLVVKSKFDSLLGQTTLLGDPELIAFLEACAVVHRQMMEVRT